MGCDIHVHTEVKINGQWHHYNAPEVNRNYALFAYMANVRNYGDITPISEPKGLPDDVSFMVQFDSDRWGDDGHSHSYLTADEIVLVDEFYKKLLEAREVKEQYWGNLFGWFFGDTFAGFTKYPEDRPEDVEDVRIIFWFDS